MKRIVIIGAGQAGLRAALSARKAGFDGSLTLVDSDPFLVPYERPPLSKWRGGDVEGRAIVPAEQIRAAGLVFRHDRVGAIDTHARTLTLESGDSLGYDRLLLTAGARARELPIPGVLSLRNKADADALRARADQAKNALIIGAGFIGLELAASLRSIGVAVRVAELAPRILTRGTTPAVARIVQKLHEAQGVTFALGHSVTEAEIESSDLIVAGIGSIPNTALAEQAGLVVEDGILVDRFLRTSAPNVFAAGDCCAAPILGEDHPPIRLEAWTAAGQQGDMAGHNMVTTGEEMACRLTPWVWSDQYDHVLQSAGLPNPAQQIVERNYSADHHISFGLADGTLAFAVGIAPGAKIAKDIRFAMKLIEAGLPVDIDALADPSIALKGLLKK